LRERKVFESGHLRVLRATRNQRETVVREWNWGVGKWKNLEELLEIKERSQALYFKQRNSRLGEFYAFIYVCKHDLHDKMYDNHPWTLLYDKFRVSEKFSETAWPAIHSCQAALTFLVYF